MKKDDRGRGTEMARPLALWRVAWQTLVSAATLYVCFVFSSAWWLLKRGDDAGFIILAVLAFGQVMILEVLYKKIMYQNASCRHWWRPLLFYTALSVAVVAVCAVYRFFMWRMHPEIPAGITFPAIVMLIGLLPALRVFVLGLWKGWYRLQ